MISVVEYLYLWFKQLQCCGVDGPLDYRRLSLPWSCCSRPEHAYESACDTHYKRGCLAVVSEQIKYTLLITAFGAAIIAIFQVNFYSNSKYYLHNQNLFLCFYRVLVYSVLSIWPYYMENMKTDMTTVSWVRKDSNNFCRFPFKTSDRIYHHH